MTRDLSIAIDGPAASGKSTLAEALAKKLDYLYFDTGVMYRAVTLAALEAGLDFEEEQAISELAESISIDVNAPSVDDGRLNDLLLDGEDRTWDIRTPAVDAKVSIVAAYPGVRSALTSQQRRIGERGGVVMVGRDIGTVVMPDADLKVYLDASLETRTERRYAELHERGDKVSAEEVADSIRKRDLIDESRAIAPLRPAEDAVLLNSDEMEPQEVLDTVMKLVQKKQAALEEQD